METLLGKDGAYIDQRISVLIIRIRVLKVSVQNTRLAASRNQDYCFKLQRTSISISRSYIIGDSGRDIEAGENAGVKGSFKVEENKACDLLRVVKGIL